MSHDSSCPDNFLVPRPRVGTSERLKLSYFNTLDHLAWSWYLLKLQIDGDVFRDPYSIDEKDWVNDLTTWPDLQYGFIILIHSLI